jgi:hypothetical protein
MQEALDFFRTQQYAKEIANNLDTNQILQLFIYGLNMQHTAKQIHKNKEWNEYDVTEQDIIYDIAAVTYNLSQIKLALKKKAIQPIFIGKDIAPLNLN